MRKVGAVILTLVMAIPAFAQPVCAAGCGGASALRASCCCAPKEAPTDGSASYSAPSCCPGEPLRADLRDIDGATSAGAGTQAAACSAQPAAAVVVIAAADASAVASPVHATGFGGPRATGPPIFIALSSLRR